MEKGVRSHQEHVWNAFFREHDGSRSCETRVGTSGQCLLAPDKGCA
jgi:hypothetical protein